MKVYKLRDRNSGLFLGANGAFSPRGKTWSNLGHVKNAFNCRKFLEPVEIVEYDVVERCSYRPTDSFYQRTWNTKTRIWAIYDERLSRTRVERG
jgi:hypothetical protein